LVIFDTGVLAFECCFNNLMSAAVYGLGVGLFLPFVLATLGTFIALPLFAQGLGSTIDVFGCAYRTKPGTHVRKAKRCTNISWFSVPVCPRVSGDAKGFSSQVVELLAACLHHRQVLHLAPPLNTPPRPSMFDHESKRIPVSLVARDRYPEIAEQIARAAQYQGNRVDQ
jgi:hypothetical protein